jgi:sialate O-acetylesterase
LAVKVFDSEVEGGIVSGDIGIYVNENDKDLSVNLRGLWDFAIEKPLFKNSDDDEFLRTDKHTPTVDAKWSKMMVPGEWEHQGFHNFNGTGWYRKQFLIPQDLEGEDLVLVLGKIDDFDHTYFNGTWIGSTNYHDKSRIYTVPAELFRAGALNILLVYVKDIQQRGGIYEGPIGLMKQSDFTRYYRNRNR